jgi:hypothetical protein
MAMRYHEEPFSSPQMTLVVTAIVLIVAALGLGAAVAWLVVPLQPGSAWSVFTARMF